MDISLQRHAVGRSRQRQQEMHENARRFADLEHTAARLALLVQKEIVRAEIEAADAP